MTATGARSPATPGGGHGRLDEDLGELCRAVTDYFLDAVQIVDWYHATQHVAQAAEALYPQDQVSAQRWQQTCRQPLYLGKLECITEPLEQAGLAAQARYFHVHRRRMQYQCFREGAIRLVRAGRRAGSNASSSG